MDWLEEYEAKYEAIKSHVITSTERVLIDSIRAYAMKHYNDDDGWDFIVECYEDYDILSQIGKARTLKGAIAKLSGTCSALNERRKY